MTKIFGDFIDELSINQEFLLLGFSTSAGPIKQRWRNNGLSADFMADYLTTFFPTREEDSSGVNQQVEIKSTVSYIANELLENAMKFNDETSPYPISIKLQLHSDRIVFLSTNSVYPQSVESFQAFIEELIASDPQELYILQLERSAEDEENQTSGLGLLTMINDYGAKIGWKFETMCDHPDAIAVTTMVQLSL